MRHLPYLAAVALAIAVPAIASPAPRSDARYAASETRGLRQDSRIAAGTASGRISPDEAARLGARQAHIDGFQTRLAADGFYSRRDYARVSYRQNRASSGIARARYNRR